MLVTDRQTDRQTEHELTGYPSIDKPWLAYYDERVWEMEIEEKSPYQQVRDVLEKYPEDYFINYFGIKTKAKEILTEIDALADFMIGRGMKPGDMVSIALPNTPESIYSFYAANKVGLTVNMVDLRLVPEKLADCLICGGNTWAFVYDESLALLDEILEKRNFHNVVSVSATESIPWLVRLVGKRNSHTTDAIRGKYITYKGALKEGRSHRFHTKDYFDPTIPVLLEHTSGTTGTPKLVEFGYRTFAGMAYNYKCSNLSIKVHDVFLNIMPPFIAYGIVASVHVPLTMGMQVVLIPKFEEEKFYDQIMTYKPSSTNATNRHWGNVKANLDRLESRFEETKEEIEKYERIIDGGITDIDDLRESRKQLRALRKANKRIGKQLSKIDLSFLVGLGIGGDVITAEFERQNNEMYQKYGCHYLLSKGYGMTEMGSTFSVAWGDYDWGLGGVGIPFPQNKMMIYDFEESQECTYDQVGELLLAGPTMMNGYVQDGRVSQDAFVVVKGEKWIRSGDLAHISEKGVLYIDGRKKRIIIKDGGLKVFPSVLEDAILRNPMVKDVCVVGVKDFLHVHIVKAHVILKDGLEIDADDFRAQMDAHLLNYLDKLFLPDLYEIDTEFPMTRSNKTDYKKIEELDEAQSGKE